MSNEKSTSEGIGILGLLGVAFIILKLCKVIDWSWWYVTMPLWGGVALAIIIAIVGILIYIISPPKPKEPIESRASNFQRRLEEMAKQRKEKEDRV